MSSLAGGKGTSGLNEMNGIDLWMRIIVDETIPNPINQIAGFFFFSFEKLGGGGRDAAVASPDKCRPSQYNRNSDGFGGQRALRAACFSEPQQTFNSPFPQPAFKACPSGADCPFLAST